MKLLAIATLVAAVLLGWSHPASAATVVIQARSNMYPTTELAAVRVVVEGADNCGETRRVVITTASKGQNWKAGVRVAELDQLQSGTIHVTVSVINRAGRVIVDRSLRAAVSGNQLRVITMLLDRPNKCIKCNTSGALPTLDGLDLVLGTGGDDLRGGNDNVDVTVGFKDGTKQTFHNVNGGRRLAGNCKKSFHLSFTRSVKRSEIAWIKLTTAFGGGIGGDNWNLDSMTVQNETHGLKLYQRTGKPLVRFTGSKHTFVATL